MPIVRKIAVDSLPNKMVSSSRPLCCRATFLPVPLTPLLLVGGTYLCFEPAEKIRTVPRSATRIDFILSAEI